MDEWEAAQRADEQRLQADILTALDASLNRTLTQEEAELLAWASGVRPDFNRSKTL